MIEPPRWVERLLSSFGAESSYCDALLGDLTEEFAIRVEEQGLDVAKRWYFRESIRSVPHLLRSWMHRFGARDLMQLVALSIAAGFVMRLLGMAIRLAIVVSFGVRPDSLAIVDLAWRDILTEAQGWRWIAAVLGETPMVVAGFVAASLYAKARMSAAAFFGVSFGAIMVIAVGGRFHAPLPAIALMTSLNVSLILAGGLLRILTGRPSEPRFGARSS